MYICTLRSFTDQGMPTCGVLETKVSHAWNDTSLLTFSTDNSNVAIQANQLSYRLWIPLLTNSIFQVKAIFFNTICPETFLGIRLYKNHDFFTHELSTSSIRFLRHEATLLHILEDSDTFIEPLEKPNKRLKTSEIHCDDTIAFHGFMSLSLMPPKLTTQKPKSLSAHIDPVIIAHRFANRCNLALSIALQDIARTGKVCIVTKDPQQWLDTCLKMNILAIEVTESISYQDYTNFTAYILPYDTIPFQMLDHTTIIESFQEMIKMIMISTPTLDQTRRFLQERFHSKFRSSLLPTLVHWTSLIMDDIPDAELKANFEYDNIVYTQITDDLVPRYPSFQKLQDYWNISPKHIRMLMPQWMKYIHCLEIPKYITRRIKFRIEKVKYTLAEQRLFDLYGSVRSIYPEVPLSHSLLRLGTIPLNKDRAKSLLENIHEHHLGSIASLVNSLVPKYIPVERALDEIQQSTVSCLVCFEECTQYMLTLCGHTYCKDCSIQLFNTISKHIHQTVACAYCRESLHVGDVFYIAPDAPTIDVVPAKQAVLDQNKMYTLYDAYSVGEITSDKIIMTDMDSDFQWVSNKFIQYVTKYAKPLKIIFVTTAQEKWVDKFMAFMNI